MSFPNSPQDPTPFGATPPPVAPVPPSAPVFSASPAPGAPVPPAVPAGAIPPPYTAAPVAPTLPGAYSPTAAAAAKTNVLAIASLVAAFFISPLAIVLGVLAKKQIRERGEGGKGLATAGLVLGILGTVGGVIALVFSLALAGAVVSASDDIAEAVATAGPTGSGEVDTPGKPMTEVEKVMAADAKQMVALQESYKATHPGAVGAEASTILGPVVIDGEKFTPSAGNLVTVGLAPVSKDLPAGGYCVVVLNEQANEPVMYDSALGQVISEDVAAGALKGACVNVAAK